MNITISGKIRPLSLCLFGILMLGVRADAQEKTTGYNYKIPEKIMTPDKVETSVGTMNFSDGMPDAATVQKCYDNLDRMRGTEAFLNGIPATSVEALRLGQYEAGAITPNKFILFDQLLDAAPLMLTGNCEAVYISGFLDLKKDGPTVVEVPAGAVPGTVNDAFFRFVVDMGAPGPDRGKGGKYIILPPDYKGNLQWSVGGKEQVVNGLKYFVAKSTSFSNFGILRGFTIGGDPAPATKMWREGIQVYPLSQISNPPKMEFIIGSKKFYNTIHANNYEFYEELNTVIQQEPASMWDPELLGLFSSIGIQKCKRFSPAARMKKTLTDAAAIGNATARALFFKPREMSYYIYPNSHWGNCFTDGDYEFLRDSARGGRNLDSRTVFYYIATVNTPAMILKIPGVRSQYAYNAEDKDGNYLDDSKNYTLHIPANPPAKNFWSVTAYDPQTRSELQTDQAFPSKESSRDKLIKNADGSFDLNYGPTAPAGKEANWTQTVPGKKWFVLFRLYGPLEPWFNKSWRPGDFVLVK